MQSKLSMKIFVVDLLKDNIPPNYYYHNYQHTLYVQERALQIGAHEHCTDEEMELLSAAALWHDTGYINTYTNHEEESCVLAKRNLPEYGFSNDEIETICSMIMATRASQSPKNKLEAILVDADLEYLGTIGAEEKSKLLFNELQSITPTLTKAEWDQTQIKFLQAHQYFTDYCKENREPVKQAYLMQLIRVAR